MLPVVEIADPAQPHPVDDRVIGAFCKVERCAVVLRQSTGWTIVGSPRGVQFPVVFVDHKDGHFSALDLPADQQTRATAAVLRWPSVANFDVFTPDLVNTPANMQMCFWYAAARGLSRWRGQMLGGGKAWSNAAVALKTKVFAALVNEHTVLACAR